MPLLTYQKLVFWDEAKQKLIHPGEFGNYREIICKEFIRFIIPRRLNIDHGFVINGNNEISTQCDVIVFDSTSAPLIENSDRQRFFPVEAIATVGEVKSTLSKTDFRSTLNKLARVKKMRDHVIGPTFIKGEQPFDPSTHSQDSIFTFLICQKVEMTADQLLKETVEAYSNEYSYTHRHNLILSIEDGLLLYTFAHQNTNNIVAQPTIKKIVTTNCFVSSEGDKHFKFFAHHLFMGRTTQDVAAYNNRGMVESLLLSG